MCTLKLNGIMVECVIGERPDERTRTQKIRVDVEMEIPETACTTDRLEDTVDYVAVKDAVTKALVEAKPQMIERAAYLAWKAIYDTLKGVATSRDGLRPVQVTITKYGAIEGLESASCVYSR